MSRMEKIAGKRTSVSRLPPLNALRTFVVTARHLNFAVAASELNVSAAAVGQQIRILEDHLGGALFDRVQGRLELTTLGRKLCPGMSDAFRLLVETLSDLDADPTRPVLFSVPPAFALKWLVPRLDRILAVVPQMELLESSVASADADCMIHFGDGRVPGLRSDFLFSESVLPLCSPEFAVTHDLAAAGPKALETLPLLHDADCFSPGWGRWLQDMRVPVPTQPYGIKLQDASLVLEAAAAGKGVALGRMRLAEAELASGRLVSPFGRPWPLQKSYFFGTPSDRPRSAAVTAILDWLRTEAS